MKRHSTIIAYDISCNKRRRRIYRCLQKWRLDQQYSLFECRLSQTEAEELFLQLSLIINDDEDALFLAWLSKDRQSKMLTAGNTGFKSPLAYQG